MIAFAYLGWISLTLIVLVTIVFATRGRAWYDYCHGDWADRMVFGHLSRMPTTPDYGSDNAPPGPQMRAMSDAA